MFKLLLQKLGTGASVRSVSFEENILKSAVFVACCAQTVSCFICPTLYTRCHCSCSQCSLGVLLHKFTLFPLSLDHWRTCFPVVQVHQRHMHNKIVHTQPQQLQRTPPQNCTSHKTLLLHPPPPSLSLPTKTQWYTFVAATNVVWFFPPPIP